MTRLFGKHRSLRRRLPLVVGSLLLGIAACSGDKTAGRGQLMLAISTDMSITGQMDVVGVEVFGSDGSVLSSQDLDLRPNGLFGMPGTLAIVPPNSGGQTVHVRVSAKHPINGSETARVVRDAIVKVPTDRVALLRMPLRWLCDSKTDCAESETCKVGECKPADIEANDLPDYTPAQVFGGGDEQGKGGYCLDAPQCFKTAVILKKPSGADCSVPLPAGADESTLNVALVLPPNTEGHCFDTNETLGAACYLPLDSDPEEGFSVVSGRIQLPPAACQRKSVASVAVSSGCRTKDLSVPICGPWTGWPGQDTPGEGGTGGEPAVAAGGKGTTGGTSSRGGAGTAEGGTGNAGEAGALASGGSDSPAVSCPASASLAPAYYYALVDASAEMGPFLGQVRQAMQQFSAQTASAGVLFGVQVSQDTCQGDYSQPVLDFTPLPVSAQDLPAFQAGPQKRIQIDSMMLDSLDTLKAIQDPSSRTMVVITAGVDQSCGTLSDLMHQALSDALSSGISVRPVLLTGADAMTSTVVQGFNVQGAPRPLNASPDSLLSQLSTIRDALAPCTFVAPANSSYWVRFGSGTSALSKVSSSAQCGTSATSYYENNGTIVLCPSACTANAGRALVTDACSPTALQSGTGGAPGAGTAGASSVGSGGSGNQTGQVGSHTADSSGDFAHAKVTVGRRDYIIQNNNFGDPLNTDLIVDYTNNSFKIASGSGASTSGPASFPSIYIGNNGSTLNGVYSTKSSDGLPLPISKVSSVISTFRYSGTTGVFNAAYDLWFANSPPTVAYSASLNGELMIWLRDPSRAAPVGSKVRTATIAGKSWDVWAGTTAQGPVVSFVNPLQDDDSRAQDFVNVDLKAFIVEAAANGITNNMYLTDVFGGFEIWTGGSGGNLGVDEFTCVVN